MSDDRTRTPAGGQTLRLPGASRDASLHDQLYRYAEDMQALLASHSELEQRYQALRASYQSVTEGRAVLEGMIESSRDIYLLTDAAGGILQSNAAAAVLGPAQLLNGSTLRNLIASSYWEHFDKLLHALGSEQPASADEIEVQFSPPPGTTDPMIVSICAMPIKSEGVLRGIHWLIRDLTRARETEFESQINALVLDNAVEGVLITDLEGNILAVNAAFSRITGYSADEVIGRNPRMFQSGRQDRRFYEGMWNTLRTDGKWQGQIYNRRKNGDIFPQWMTLTSARDHEGKVLSYIAVFADIARLIQAEQKLFHLAHHDALTGLPNRQLLLERLGQLLGMAKRNQGTFAVLFIDLDGFKEINDSFGHAAGDRALEIIAERLTTCMRAVDTVARLGGDEFVVLAPGLATTADIDVLVAKLQQAIAPPLAFADETRCVSASIGCALYPKHAENALDLIECADAAMYHAKQSCAQGHALYTSAMQRRSTGRMRAPDAGAH